MQLCIWPAESSIRNYCNQREYPALWRRSLICSLYLIWFIGLEMTLHGCTTAPIVPTKPVTSACEIVPETLVLQNQTVTLPAIGKFVLESHLATKEDTFANGRAFPQTVSEGIGAHLARSCALMDKPGCEAAVYTSQWHKTWTPPEGGLAGQGAVGDIKPSAAEEMWSGNMFWKTKPPLGTRYLATANGKSVVVLMGWEVGPRDPVYLGGLQGEVMYALGATDESQIRLGKLKDQSLPAGPVDCGGAQ